MNQSNRYLREIEIGEVFTGFYVLRQRELRTRRDGNPYLFLEFGDRSGRLSGIIWDDAPRMYTELKKECVVKLRGRIEEYQGDRQVAIKQLRMAKDDDEFDMEDFLPVTSIDIDGAIHRLKRMTQSFSNRYLRDLVGSFFDDPGWLESFRQAPGGKLWHHNRIGGLLEHTVSMCRLCRYLARFYPEVDRDLLIVGAMLHDIGKIEEYRYGTVIDYTDRGRLVGHITLGAEWVTERAKQIDGFPPDLLDRLIHLILSHQGEHGSPVQPATREAFLLHFVDEIDSKMDALRRIREGLPEDEEWIYVRLLERHVNLGAT